VAAVDFLPTLCKLAGVSVPASMQLDGDDSSDVLLGKSRSRTRPLMWEWRFRIAGEVFHQSPILAIREGNWKLLINPDRSRVELYDIPHDPTQLSNLAEQKPDLVDRLAKQVLAWQQTLPAGPTDAAAGNNTYPTPGQQRDR
jgi:arylsulfatase A-like enzyme